MRWFVHLDTDSMTGESFQDSASAHDHRLLYGLRKRHTRRMGSDSGYSRVERLFGTLDELGSGRIFRIASHDHTDCRISYSSLIDHATIYLQEVSGF